jgi:ABC-type uncharacterized transport system auxiliary subunit
MFNLKIGRIAKHARREVILICEHAVSNQKDSFSMTFGMALRDKTNYNLLTRIFGLLLCALCPLLSSCGGVPETFYYTLAFDHSAPQDDGHAPLPFALGVEKFQSEVIYDDDRIIYRDSPYEVKYYFYRRWVAPPRHLITEKIVSYLSDRGLFEKVTTHPSMVNVKYVLNGRLLAFEEWDEQNNWFGKVAFKASLYEPATQRVVWSGKFEHIEPVAKKIPASVVEALSLSMKKCLEDMTQSLVKELETQESVP